MSKFQPGQSGNPFGRPAGSKHKLSERFLEALQKDFAEHGVTAIKTVRETKPDQYLKVVASLVPKDINVAIDPFEDMSDAELVASIKFLKEELREKGFSFGDEDERDDQATSH